MKQLFTKYQRWILASGLFAALTLCALAEDFTFNIPMEFHKIHPFIKYGFVNVRLYTAAYVPALQTHNTTLAIQSQVTYGTSADFQIVNGEFSGILVVKCNAPSKTAPGHRAQDAVYYDLLLVLKDTYYDNADGVGRMLGSIPGETYGYDTTKPFVYWASGKINQPLKLNIPQRTKIIKH